MRLYSAEIRHRLIDSYLMKARTKSTAHLDLNTPEGAERFRKATEAFTRRACRSKESALRVLVEEGIYTKSGKLTKRYS
jgi:hypothetical protein